MAITNTTARNNGPLSFIDVALGDDTTTTKANIIDDTFIFFNKDDDVEEAQVEELNYDAIHN